MAYSQRPAQRPPPMRQYNSPTSPSAGPRYAPDADYGDTHGNGGYGYPDGGGEGYEDPTYSYQSSSSGPQPYGSSKQPRSMRSPPGPGPGGLDPRRPPPGQSRSRTPGGRPPGFDGPFPSVPPGRDPRDPRDRRGPAPRGDPRGDPRGLDRGMAAMDINGRGPPPRPHTSNSNGRRPDMRPPPQRGPPPGRGRGGYYPGPTRAPSSGRPDRAYTDPNGPPMGGPGRSATMPLNPPTMYPGQATYQEQDYASGYMGEMPTRPNTAGGMRPPRRPVNDMDMGLMIPNDPANRISYAPKEFLDSYYDKEHDKESADDEPDMPNFDAMPSATTGPMDEMGLDTPPKPVLQTPTTPTSPAGGQYAAYTPESSQGAPRSRSQPDLRGADAPVNQFENAGFQFDIPGEAPPIPAMYPPNGGGYQNGYEDMHNYPSNGHVAYPPNPVGFPHDQPEILEPQQNPDALPSHPAPFRPGLDQKPVPVRQYNATQVAAPASAPTPAQAAPQPMPNEPTGPKPVTHEELQQLQQKARGNPSDQKTQLLLAKKLVEAATVLVVDNSRLDPKTKAKAKEKYVMDAYKIVKKLVSAGNADAQFYLADCYGEGLLGLETDAKEAFSLYHSAAKQGHAQSAYRVAVCCEIGAEEGGGTKRDPFKAVQWYKRAAALGDTPAMYKMGMINLKGLLGQARSPREGVSWLKRAAERADEENPHALHELALMYQNASGNDIIVRDEQYASQLFHQAADLGYKFSQFRLGTAYEYGLMGCPVDNRMSIIWYTRAAAQGEHQSELALSGWYLTGSDGILQQNDTEAYLWARKAATAGLSKAEYAMGYFTEVGIGVTANLDDAKRWYWRAAAQGFPKARERLEDLKKGGSRMQKTRLSRSAVNKQSDGDCVVM
ncbi:hypothetical protein N7462_000986 [Penicillium macrosclerotiorum]|uniref:uncharacterized protein n=1 Tax=Penicillium macrosclerotiorum TaxID=303699 RepID=UPI0025493F20|nr:uncharacterized protein N7462_000986 [Penicillium macrosclerotiorum]KAJ5698981.1 hypothetical protein N7462_000986 [Penicillium macrosclerotiorum]